jgi:hypothetical protein
MKNSLKSNWKENVARDFIALGSIPFFILVLVRTYLLDKPYYFSQFIIAGVIFLIIAYILKTSMYSGMALIALIFTMLYYNDMKYNVFGVIAYLLLIASMFYIKEPKKKILLGVVFGAAATGISYYLVTLLF